MIELLLALLIGGLSLIACGSLASKFRSAPIPSDVVKTPPGGPTDEKLEILVDPATAGWSTLDDLQLVRLLRDSTIR